MIYHYFGSKEELFQTVLEDAYMAIRTAEQALELDHLSPREALETLVRFTWTYYLEIRNSFRWSTAPICTGAASGKVRAHPNRQPPLR